MPGFKTWILGAIAQTDWQCSRQFHITAFCSISEQSSAFKGTGVNSQRVTYEHVRAMSLGAIYGQPVPGNLQEAKAFQFEF